MFNLLILVLVNIFDNYIKWIIIIKDIANSWLRINNLVKAYKATKDINNEKKLIIAKTLPSWL